MYVVAIGTAWDGFVLYGPFQEADDAYEYAEECDEEWNIVELMVP